MAYYVCRLKRNHCHKGQSNRTQWDRQYFIDVKCEVPADVYIHSLFQSVPPSNWLCTWFSVNTKIVKVLAFLAAHVSQATAELLLFCQYTHPILSL